MFNLSRRFKKISLISVFSLMLAAVVGLSVALGIVCNKDKEQWDVVTDKYAYKVTYFSISETSEEPQLGGIFFKIKNLTNVSTCYSFNTKIYDKKDNSIVYGYSGGGNGVTVADGYTYFDSTTNIDSLYCCTMFITTQETTTLRILFSDVSIHGIIVPKKINFKNYYCLIENFSIKDIDNTIYLY